MDSHLPLPPHLEWFVREQVVAGRFPSEGEVIRAALRLLERSSGASPSDRALPGPAAASSDLSSPAPAGRRSPRGLLADLPSGLSYDDLRDARYELWAGLHPGGAG